MSNLKRVHIFMYKKDYEHLQNTLPDKSFSKFVRTLLHKYVKKNKVEAQMILENEGEDINNSNIPHTHTLEDGTKVLDAEWAKNNLNDYLYEDNNE